MLLSFKYRSALLCILLFFSICAFGQQVIEKDVNDNNYNGRVKRAFIKAPVLLVNALTKDKNTDKEKFDALFNWVSRNINYDYGLYYSSGGASAPQFRRILKSRRGVCIDYAYLMDTLCYMAGISNVSIYGYAKDEVFDVNDSIYIDNHAWNAVKLDNLWYLYDITWSKGRMYYRYTKFSRFIMNIKNRFTVKYVPVVIKQKKSRYFRKVVCGGFVAVDSAAHKITVYKKVYRHKLLRHFLGMFRLKIIRTYKEEPNTNFYLADPKVFAITHFPDDPDWSLLPQQSMRTFECDSSFYHLTQHDYDTQQKRGLNSGTCTNELTFDELTKNEHMRKQSLAFNPRNRFIISLCDYNLAGIKLEESKKLDDSLSKITVLDTSLSLIEQAKGSLTQTLRNIETESTLQNAKNLKKLDLLEEDNQKHRAFIRSKIEISVRETKNIKDLEDRVNLYASRFYFRNRTIMHYKKGSEIDRDAKRVLYTINYLKQQLAERTRKVDSLNVLIDALKTVFNNALPDLHQTLKIKVENHDSLVLPIAESIKLRLDLLDNYKKKVVEVRKDIFLFEKNYANGLDSSIYKPADFCYEVGNRVFSLIDERNKITFEIYKLNCQLVKFKELEPDVLDTYNKHLINENADDLCWIRGNDTYLQGVFYGFKSLLGKQKDFDNKLGVENRIEVSRYLFINRELSRRRRKYQHIVAGNRYVFNMKHRQIRKEKNEFLKKLLKERREARIAAAKNK